MTITVNLNATTGTGTTTYTEGTPVTLFSNATFVGSGFQNNNDNDRVDTVTVKIANPAATRALSLTSTAATLASNNNVSVTYNAATGTLTLSGNNENDSVWQSILQGVQYNDTSDNPGAPGTVTVVGTNGSNGNTGTDTHAIAITSVNDAPSGTTAVKTINEDTAYTFAAADFGFTDVDGNTLLAVKITTLPSGGSLALNGVAVTAGQTIAAASLANLVYTPAANTNGNGAASFTFQVQDNGGTENGGVDLDQSANSFTFNVTSVNDAPSGTTTVKTINEDTAYTFAAADFGFTDVDGNSLLAVKITTLPSGGSLTLNGIAVTVGQTIAAASLANLVFTPTANANGNGAASFTFQVQDNGGTTNGGVDLDQSANSFTFNVTPINDAAVITGTSTASLTETNAVLTAGGSLSATDVDSSAAFVAQTDTAGSNGFGTFSIDANGVWSYVANSAHNEFAEGTTHTDSVTVATADGTTKVITVTITGTNDAAVITGTSTADLTETNAALTAGGSLSATDVDGSAAFVAQTDTAGDYGTFTIGTDGAWTYVALAHNEFAEGTTHTDTFTVLAADGTATSVTVNILGTNDAAVLSSETIDLTETDAALSTSGTLTISDVDSDETFQAQTDTAGLYGTFTIGTDGAWTYVASAHNEFAEGTTHTDTFTVLAADGTATSVTVNILGTNDAAVLSSETIDLTETDAALSTSGTLTISDVDSAATFQAQTDTAGDYGTFTIGTDGAWTYVASAHNEFAEGTTHTDTFTVLAADGTETSVTVNILGTNDAAVLSSATTDLTETDAALSTSGTLTISDVDSAATFQAQTDTAGLYGTFTIGTDGAWTYVASAHNEFAEGTTHTDTFTVLAADGTATSVTVNILGTNDAAVLSSETIDLTETDAALSTSGTLTISDVDSDETFQAQTDTAGLYGTFTIGTDGAWTYVASAHNEFAEGTTHTDTFTVLAADGTATSVTVNILGTNDAPDAVSLDVNTITEGAPDGAVVGLLTATDEDGDALTFTLVDAAGDPLDSDLFEIGVDENGNPALVVKAGVTLDEANLGAHTIHVKANDGLADSSVQELTITVTGRNDNAPVANVPTTSRTVADNATVALFADTTFTDADGDHLKVSITISDLAKGALANLGAGTFDAATRTYTVEGTAAEVTNAVKGLTFDPTDRPNAAVGAMETTTFTIKVEDGDAAHTAEKTVSVDSIAANRAPTGIALTGGAVLELSAKDTVVGSLKAADTNAGETFTYTLSDDANGRFAIAGDQIVVKEGTKLDYEQSKSHQVKVKATDASGASFETIFSLGVLDFAVEKTAGSSGNDVFVGGKYKDNLSGGLGNDILNGGLGNDILKGGAGHDVFVFNTKLSKSANRDKIVDFNVKDDSVYLDNAIFKKLGKGTPEKPVKLNKAFFTIGEAKDKNDYVLYDKAKGVLSYDADGSGSGKAVEFATTTENLKLTAADFFVI